MGKGKAKGKGKGSMRNMGDMGEREETRVLRAKGKFRVIGCTGCWGFGGIRNREDCGCAVC